jgi:hypothetical protein
LNEADPNGAAPSTLPQEFTMKAIVTLLAAALTVTGCSNLTGPDDAAARAAAARRKLEVASKVPEPSMKLSAN